MPYFQQFAAISVVELTIFCGSYDHANAKSMVREPMFCGSCDSNPLKSEHPLGWILYTFDGSDDNMERINVSQMTIPIHISDA